MNDLIHKLAKIPDHWRGTVAGAALLTAALTLASCNAFDGKVVSSNSGQLSDREQLHSEYVTTSNELEKKWDQADALESQAQRMKSEVVRDAERVDADFEHDYTAADAEIVKRAEFMGKIGEVVQTASPGIPWLGPLITAGLASLAGGAGYDAIRKNRVITRMKAAQPPG